MTKLFMVSLFTSLSLAQVALAETSTASVYHERPSLGFQAGMNFENASTPSQISSNTYTGFTAGLNLEIPITDSFSIQPEVNYSRRGYNLVDSGGARADVYYHAIEVPAFAKLSLGQSFRPVFFAGPMMVFNVSREVQSNFGGTSTSSSVELRTTDVAAVAGAGFEAGSFFLNARYALGIIDISENSAGYYSRGFKLLGGVRI